MAKEGGDQKAAGHFKFLRAKRAKKTGGKQELVKVQFMVESSSEATAFKKLFDERMEKEGGEKA
eukprot:8280069-Pyramimonas_sp.AAC.1